VSLAAAPSESPAQERATPVYKRWWLWTVVGVAVVGIGLGVGLGLGLSSQGGGNPPPSSQLGNVQLF
jgi:hypothetical protein